MRHGLSLLEVLVAMTVLAIALGGLMTGAGQAQRAASVATGLTEASIIASGLLASARTAPPAALQTGVIDPGDYRWRRWAEPDVVPGSRRIIVEVDYPLAGTRAVHRLVGLAAERPLSLLER